MRILSADNLDASGSQTGWRGSLSRRALASFVTSVPDRSQAAARRVSTDPARYARARKRTILDRHGNPGWYEWTLREFARTLFGIGILALLVFVPLQMELSWLPRDAPPMPDPALVAILAFVAIVVIVVLALFAYGQLWGERGWVERKVASHRAASHTEAGHASGYIFHSR